MGIKSAIKGLKATDRSNDNRETIIEGAEGTEEIQVHSGQPQFEKVVWYREPHLRKLYFMSIFLFIASATTGYDGMMVNTSQQMDAWHNYFPETSNANKLGILINMYNIGSIISFFIVPYMADNIGRKITIMIGCGFMILGALIGAFCNGYGMYIAGRFIMGFGNSMAQMCSPMLLTEICHPQHRGIVTTIYNCLWSFGSLSVSAIGWGTANIAGDWSWRSITFIQCVPSLIQIAGVWWFPESPRYLVSKDRLDEALDVLAKHHAGGDSQNAVVQFQYREIKELVHDRKAQSTSYKDFFATKGNRWRLAIIVSLGVFSQYSGNAVFSNYINIVYKNAGITSQNKKLALSCGQSAMSLIVAVTAATTVEHYGRRPLFLVGSLGAALSYMLWMVCSIVFQNSGVVQPDGSVVYMNQNAGNAQIAMVWLFQVFFHISFSGLLVAYALEILPFHLRAKGMTILNITTQAILALGNQTNQIAWNAFKHKWNFMLFYTLWDLFEFAFVYFVYVETKGHTLENIATIFDGDKASAHIDLHQVEKETNLTRHEEHAHDKSLA